MVDEDFLEDLADRLGKLDYGLISDADINRIRSISVSIASQKLGFGVAELSQLCDDCEFCKTSGPSGSRSFPPRIPYCEKLMEPLPYAKVETSKGIEAHRTGFAKEKCPLLKGESDDAL